MHVETYACICADMYKCVYMCAHMYVCTHVCVHVCMYQCRYLCDQTYRGLYDIHTYACMFACVHTNVPNLYFDITVKIFYISLNKYGCHFANMSQSDIMLHCINILHMWTRTQGIAIYSSQVIAMCVTARNMSLKIPHMQIVHV